MPGCEQKNENFWIAMADQADAVQALHPDWSLREVKVEVARLLRPKFKLDIASIKAEQSGTQNCDLDIELTSDGDIRYVKYGRTLTELNERTRRLTPEQYHPEDAVTNSAIRAAFAQGATRVVTSYWRPGEDHRDFVVMELDKKTGKGKSKTVNAESLTGKTYSMREMAEQAKKIFTDVRVQFAENQLFIATDMDLNKKNIREIKNNYTKREQVKVVDANHEVASQRHHRQLVDTVIDINEQEIVTHEFAGELVIRNLLLDEKNKKSLELLIVEPEGLNPDRAQKVWESKAQEVFEISPEQSKKLLDDLNEMHETMQDAKKMIALVSDLGEDFAGIGLYALEAMTLTDMAFFKDESITPIESVEIQAQELFVQFQQMEEAETIIAITDVTGIGIGGALVALEQVALMEISQETAQDSAVLSDDEKTIVYSLFSKEHIEHIQLPESVDRHVVQQTVEFVQKIDQLELPQQVAAIEEETTRVEEVIVTVWETLVADKPAAEIHSPHELIQVDQETKDFSFAFTVWILFKFMAYRRSLVTLKEFVTHPNDSEISLGERINKLRPEGLIQKEPTPWLLFAIIWKLAMIREQGKATNQTVPQKNKKKTYPIVIYTYAS